METLNFKLSSKNLIKKTRRNLYMNGKFIEVEFIQLDF